MADTTAATVEFELVSPAKLLVSEPVEMAVVPGAEGDIGVLPGHSPLIATVRPGIIDNHVGGKVRNRIFNFVGNHFNSLNFILDIIIFIICYFYWKPIFYNHFTFEFDYIFIR